MAVLASVAAVTPAGTARETGSAQVEDTTETGGSEWRMPPVPMTMPMLPGMRALRPPARPFLPGAEIASEELPASVPRKVIPLSDGDTLRLESTIVRHRVEDRTFVMYGYNRQIPGPLIRTEQGATILVQFRNEIGLPSTVHWHGVRLDNRFDGVPDVTQEPVEPGEGFEYRVHLPDAGVYWYHPHVRSDIQQDLGLYGNLLVTPRDSGYYGPVNREEVLVLDDLLAGPEGLFPYGREAGTHALMGRFGNLLLVNGGRDWEAEVDRGAVVRFFLTNVSNTRTFNLSLPGARMKVVAADIGRFEREAWVDNIILGPAQRYTVDARFPEPGTVPLVHRIQAIDHFRGEFYPEVDTLGRVRVGEKAARPDHTAGFDTLRAGGPPDTLRQRLRARSDDPPDRELTLTLRQRGLPQSFLGIMAMDTLYRPPMEWNDMMPMMNWVSSSRTVEWIFRDPDTGRENMDIHWRFQRGDLIKIRIHNSAGSLHPMQHPIHLHGQRFVVLEQDGVSNDNLAWRDTAIIPAGSTVDLLVEMSNPGDWLLHCHISEHIEAGMKTRFTVEAPE